MKNRIFRMQDISHISFLVLAALTLIFRLNIYMMLPRTALNFLLVSVDMDTQTQWFLG